MTKKIFFASFFLFTSTFSFSQGVTFDAKALLFLTDADMSAFSIADGILRKMPNRMDLISTVSFPLTYGDPDLIVSDKASNSLIGSHKDIAISSDQKRAYVLETRSETTDDAIAIEHILDEFPAGDYITVVDIEDPKKPKSLYRFSVGENPQSISLDSKGRYLAITTEVYGKEIRIFELDQSGKPVRVIPKPGQLPPGKIVDLTWHPDGEHLAYINQDESEVGIIKLLKDGPSGDVIRSEIEGPTVKLSGFLTHGEFSPDGNYFLVLDAKKELDNEEITDPGEIYVIKFNFDTGKHFLNDKAKVEENPTSFEFHPDGSYLLVSNMKKSFYTNPPLGQASAASFSLLQLNADGTIKLLENYPVEGMMPSSVAFDKSGENIAYSVFEYRSYGYTLGGIEFLKFNAAAKTKLSSQKSRIYVPRGIHSLKPLIDY